MGIWGLIASKAEAVKRNAPDATPVKNAYRHSYNLGSAAFAKIGQTVRTVALRRGTQPTPADDVPAKEVETDRGVIDTNSMKKGCTSSCAYGYGFTTFAKIGYTVRVKCVYRIVHMMKKDCTESITGIYATSFSKDIALHEPMVGDDIIPGQAFAMPMKKECMSSYTFGFITFAKIGYVVRVNVYRCGQWMSDDDTKSTMALYSTIFTKNFRRYILEDKSIQGGLGVGLLMSLVITLKDIMVKVKAGSQREEVLISLWNDIIALMMREPFRTQIFFKGDYTMKSFVLFVIELLVCTMKRYGGTQYSSQEVEILAGIVGSLVKQPRKNAFEIHEATWMKCLSLIGPHFWSRQEEIVLAKPGSKDFEATTKKRGKKKG